MSQYLNVYFKIGDNYLSAGNFSRNSQIYQLLVDYLPYEKLINFSKTRLDIFRDKIDEKIKSIKRLCALKEEEITIVSNFNNDVDEKISTINFIRETLADLQEELEECTYFSNVLLYWDDIRAEAVWENTDPNFDADTIIWGGIEARPPKKES